MSTVSSFIQNNRAEAERIANEQAMERQRRDAAWRPPFIEVGMDVVWFEAGDTDREPYIGKVNKVSGRFINLVLHGAVGRTAVRHVDDPTLVHNPNHRENGGWDFTPAWKTEMAERRAIVAMQDQLNERLAVIENEMGIRKAEEKAETLPDPKTLKTTK